MWTGGRPSTHTLAGSGPAVRPAGRPAGRLWGGGGGGGGDTHADDALLGVLRLLALLDAVDLLQLVRVALTRRKCVCARERFRERERDALHDAIDLLQLVRAALHARASCTRTRLRARFGRGRVSAFCAFCACAESRQGTALAPSARRRAPGPGSSA